MPLGWSFSLAELVVGRRLTVAAERYAEVMARQDWFDHIGQDGSTITERAEAAGYVSWTYLAENLVGEADRQTLTALWPLVTVRKPPELPLAPGFAASGGWVNWEIPNRLTSQPVALSSVGVTAPRPV